MSGFFPRKMKIRRFYLEKFDETKHESTAELDTMDLCFKHLNLFNKVRKKENRLNFDVEDVYDEELIIPPDVKCEFCK